VLVVVIQRPQIVHDAQIVHNATGNGSISWLHGTKKRGAITGLIGEFVNGEFGRLKTE
jgi:hypothetical protein